MKITVNVDDVRYDDDVEPRLLLVHYLREQAGRTGTPIGCDTSNCGACTVLMDGSSVKSCAVLAVQADGSSVNCCIWVAVPLVKLRLDPYKVVIQAVRSYPNFSTTHLLDGFKIVLRGH